MTDVKHIAILSQVTAQAKTIRQQLSQALTKHGFALVKAKPDLYITVGGDGTFLHHVRSLNYPQTPFIGINAGSLGFFQEVEARNIKEFAQDLKQRHYNLVALPLLAVSIDGHSQTVALNEVVIERASARAVHLEVKIDGQVFEKFVGDGLIVATPQGSSAYSSAAGGAVIPFGLKLMQLVPSNPHDSTMYISIRSPLILADHSVVTIRAHQDKLRPFRVVADGGLVASRQQSQVKIMLSRRCIYLMRTHRFNYYTRLAHKMIRRH
ncbi:NAD(+)/NADH kinase [Candidatus Microgenomates bacterium]|nr:NAD(+)/NADH kinase [Candidatus Microgenomates bacterium]